MNEEINPVDMPTVDDLRNIIRKSLNHMRQFMQNDPRWAIAMCEQNADRGFAYTELKHMARLDVWQEEHRRDELLRRGFTPPENFEVKK